MTENNNNTTTTKIEQQQQLPSHLPSTFPLNFLLENAQKFANNNNNCIDDSRPCSSLSITETCSKNDLNENQQQQSATIKNELNDLIEMDTSSVNRSISSDSVILFFMT